MRVVFILLGVFWAQSVWAATPMSQQQVMQVERYLNQVHTMVAQFTQTTDDGDVSSGTFYLSRPGKLRWQYKPPVPILIIANKGLLTYYDEQLDQTSHLPVGDNLGGFLTQKKIDFTQGVQIVESSVEGGELSLTLTQADKPLDGSLTLIFGQENVALRRMIVLDAIGKKTTVEFSDIRYGQSLRKNLFILPKKWDKKR